MAQLILRLGPEEGSKSKEEMMAIVDADVVDFSNWMANLPDFRARGALSNPEKALIKTYIVQKLNERF